MRKEVMLRAARLALVAGMDPEHVYGWMMDVGRAKQKHPCKLDIAAITGMVYLKGEIDSYRLEKYVAPKAWEPAYTGPDYENLILARQEAWMD